MEIKSLSRMIFKKQYSPEVFKEYQEWIEYVVNIYAPIRDSETGDFRFLPFPGSLMEQPYKSMLILRAIQNTYREVASEEQKAMLQNAKASHK